jgi:hypothetical protein
VAALVDVRLIGSTTKMQGGAENTDGESSRTTASQLSVVVRLHGGCSGNGMAELPMCAGTAWEKR